MAAAVIIAKGTYCTVYKEIFEGEEVAVKYLPKGAKTDQEIELLNRVHDIPNVIKVCGVQYTDSHVRLIMDYVPTTLLDLVEGRDGGVSMRRVSGILDQLVRVVGAIHARGIVHKDIKLENILYKDGQIQLCDFGFSKAFTPGKRGLQDNQGSMHYSSPEIWNSQHYEGPEVDVWAMGVCIFLLATSYFPFGGDSTKEVFVQIEKRCVWFPPHVKSRRFRDLLSRMLAYNPAERITMSEIREHPFLLAFVKGHQDTKLGTAFSSASWDSRPPKLHETFSCVDDELVSPTKQRFALAHTASTADDYAFDNTATKTPVSKSERGELFTGNRSDDAGRKKGLFGFKFPTLRSS